MDGGMARAVKTSVGRALASALPRTVLCGLVERLCERDPSVVRHGIATSLAAARTLDTMPFDLPVARSLEFDNLAGLFASSSLDHGVIAMPIRQAAYVFGLVRRLAPGKVIEIGRFRGGSTLVIAAAMGGRGRFWSIDIGQPGCDAGARPVE